MKREFVWKAEVLYVDLVVIHLIDKSEFSYHTYKISH